MKNIITLNEIIKILLIHSTSKRCITVQTTEMSSMSVYFSRSGHMQTTRVYMKTEISLQCPSILYGDAMELGGPDRDEMFVCDPG